MPDVGRHQATLLLQRRIMILNTENCELLLSDNEYEIDDRNSPDRSRRGQFKAGWNDATIRGRTYRDKTMKHLTWHNLGYRVGKKIGAKDEAEIYEYYDCFARDYERKKDEQSR